MSQISLKTHYVYPEIQYDNKLNIWTAVLYDIKGIVKENFQGTAESRKEAIEKATEKLNSAAVKYIHEKNYIKQNPTIKKL